MRGSERFGLIVIATVADCAVADCAVAAAAATEHYPFGDVSIGNIVVGFCWCCDLTVYYRCC